MKFFPKGGVEGKGKGQKRRLGGFRKGLVGFLEGKKRPRFGLYWTWTFRIFTKKLGFQKTKGKERKGNYFLKREGYLGETFKTRF